jgi:hypothetical protein
MENSGSVQFFLDMMGPYKWVMIVLAAFVLVLITRKIRDLYLRKSPSVPQLQKGINSILFWGVFTLVIGIFAQFASLWTAMKEIMMASDVSPIIITLGTLSSFASTIFGLGVFIIAGLFWWLCRNRASTLLEGQAA